MPNANDLKPKWTDKGNMNWLNRMQWTHHWKTMILKWHLTWHIIFSYEPNQFLSALHSLNAFTESLADVRVMTALNGIIGIGFSQWCWNHIWLFAPFMFMITNDSNNRLSCLLKQQARIMFNGSPSLIPSCSTSIWTWFTASMIFIGRLTCRFRSFNATRMLPLRSYHNRSPWNNQRAYCPHVRNGIIHRNAMPCSFSTMRQFYRR